MGVFRRQPLKAFDITNGYGVLDLPGATYSHAPCPSDALSISMHTQREVYIYTQILVCRMSLRYAMLSQIAVVFKRLPLVFMAGV
jgi:hypothetical protein